MNVVIDFAIAFAVVGVVLTFTAGLGYVLDRRDARRVLRQFDAFIEEQNRRYYR